MEKAKPYRGIVQIVCMVRGICPRGVKKNVRPDCAACPEAVTRIVDLDGKVLHESRALEAVHEAPGKKQPKKPAAAKAPTVKKEE